jgi:hypothetical protein
MLRKIYVPLVASAALLLSAGSAQAVNVVTNGDFESGLTGWLTFTNGGSIGIASENSPLGPAGTQSAQLSADTNIANPSFPILKIERLAPGQLINGAPVTVKFDARAPIQTVDSNAGDQDRQGCIHCGALQRVH